MTKTNKGKRKGGSKTSQLAPCASSQYYPASSHAHHQAAVLAAAVAGGGRYDGVDFILDHIDHEMQKMNKAAKKKKPSKAERQQLRQQGVEFDTGDDTSGGVNTKLALRDGLAKLKASKSSAHEKSTTDGDDTGLGTASLQDDSDGGGQTQQPAEIIGKVDIYQSANSEESTEEEGEETPTPAGFELDSDVAKQLDAQYKQILKKKTGAEQERASIAQKRGDANKDQEDNDSVLTEDLLNSYKQYIVAKSSESSGIASPKRGGNTKKRRDSLTDHDSVRTEDIAAEFQKTLVPTYTAEKAKTPKSKPKKHYFVIDTSTPTKVRSTHSSLARQPVKATTPIKVAPQTTMAARGMFNVPIMSPKKSKRKKNGKFSDQESIMTEDFEHQFRKSCVKQIANVPIMCFDQRQIDSDLETVNSQIIRDALRAKESDDEDEDDDEDETSEDSENGMLNTVISQQQMQELMRQGWKRPSASWDHTPTATNNTTNGTSANAATILGGPSMSSASRSTSHSSSPALNNLRQAAAASAAANAAAKASRGANRYTMELATDSRTSFGAESLEEDAKEMERESAKMRQEVENNLRSSSSSKKRGASQSKAPQFGSALNALQSLQIPSESDSSGLNAEQLQQHNIRLNAAMSLGKKEKFALEKEIRRLIDEERRAKQKIKDLEVQVQKQQHDQEEARSSTMVLEFTLSSKQQELQKLEDAIIAKNNELIGIEEGEKNKETMIKGQQEQQLQAAKSERERLVAEINALRTKTQSLEAKERERAEIERQLSTTKEDLFAEQKRARTHMDTLKEELEQKAGRIEELLTERNKQQTNYQKLEDQFKQMETEKNTVIKEKSDEFSELKQRNQELMVQSRSNHSQESSELRKEAAELRKQLQEVTEKLEGVNLQLTRSEECNLKLREQFLDVQRQAAEEKETKNELKSQLVNQQAQQEAALKHASMQADQAQQAALEGLRQEMSLTSQQLLQQAENRLKMTIEQMEDQLTGKEVELQALIDKVRNNEAQTERYAQQLRQESQERLHEALREERGVWEQEKEQETRRIRVNLEEEMERMSKQLRQELDYERDATDKQKRQISALTSELEETREANRQAYREKVDAIDQIKQTAEQEKARELDFLREKIEKETHRSLDRLRDTIERQGEELLRLRAENEERGQQLNETNETVNKNVRQAVKEVNDTCRLMASLLAIMPRTVNLAMYNGWSGVAGSSGKSSALSAAIDNLRMTVEDAGKLVSQLRHDVEVNKEALIRADRDKALAMDDMKQKMQKEKLAALESLKNRLIEEHIQEMENWNVSGKHGDIKSTLKSSSSASNGNGDRSAQRELREKDAEMREVQRNMSSWQKQQTDKMARKFQEEMNRELEKRSKEHKEKQRSWEREMMAHKREMERLERELQHMRMVSKLANKGGVSPGLPSHGTNPTVMQSAKFTPSNSATTTAASGMFHGSSPNLFGRPPSPSPHHHARIGSSPPGGDSTTSAAQLRQLQSQVKSLQAENSTLRRAKSLSANSVPDLSVINRSLSGDYQQSEGRKAALHDAQMKQMELRVKQAEDRAKKNDHRLNDKILEMSKLQATLAQQSKECMQLERTVSQLKQQGNPSHVSFHR